LDELPLEGTLRRAPILAIREQFPTACGPLHFLNKRNLDYRAAGALQALVMGRHNSRD
jgi:hypothetical protein